MIKTNDGFPTRLKRAREWAGFSQALLAQKAKLPASSISNFESGKREPSLNSFRAICYALNVNSEYLICRNRYLHRAIPTKLLESLEVLDNEDAEFVDRIIGLLSKQS